MEFLEISIPILSVCIELEKILIIFLLVLSISSEKSFVQFIVTVNYSVLSPNPLI